MPQLHNVPTAPEGGWTLQSYFDEAVRYLASMAEPCTVTDDGDIACTYRTESGSACLVGHFVPNDHIVADEYQSFITVGVTDLIRFPELAGVAWPTDNIELANDLQHVHDSTGYWSKRGFVAPGRLREIAAHWNLDSAVIDAQTWTER